MIPPSRVIRSIARESERSTVPSTGLIFHALASVLKASWGEALFSNLGIGLIFFLLALVGVVVMILGIYLIVAVSVVVGIVLVVIAVLYWVFLAILSSAVHAVLMTALYRFATTGKTSMEFPAPVLQNPWNM